MARQGALFPDPETTIAVDVSRGEPRLWVQRMVIWEKPGEVIREIRLRRGLNVVWSPDPGSDAAELGRDAGSGHGAGKTLFCRFLRYCLGEERFSNDKLRKEIVGALPAGLVGIELFLQGRKWAVIRPIGQTRRESARENISLEDMVDSKESSSGVDAFLEALNSSLFQGGTAGCLPVSRQNAAWLLALAWLTRDQECRFDRVLDWRHPRAESRSIALGLSGEQALVVARTFLGIIEAEELRLKLERDKLAEEKREHERNITYCQRRRDELLSELTNDLLPGVNVGGDELGASTLRETAKRELQRLEREIDERQPGDAEKADRSGLEATLAEIALVDNQIKGFESTRELQKEQLKALRGERANLNAAEIKARLGPICPVCSVPIDRALAEGCGLSHHFPNAANIASEKQNLAEQVRACNEAVSRCDRLLSEHRSRLRDLRSQEAGFRSRVKAHEKRAAEQLRNMRQEWFNAKQRLEQAEELLLLLRRALREQESLSRSTRRDQEFADQQSAIRDQHRASLSRLQDLFSYVCRAVLGSAASASVTLSGRGLETHVDVGGMAMESLKAIAFDVAAMLMSVEGRAALPAFLVHDSPREADLGEAIYHRLFRLMQRLEHLSKDPPFQYVITTTTKPPTDLCCPPYLVEELHGANVDGRLLRRNLG